MVFLPDYNVSLAEMIIPAADVSEQISTAGMEASGTGNMKLALNGALTIGTLDGANLEILDRVGADNMFIFGLTAEQVEERRRNRGVERCRCRRHCGGAGPDRFGCVLAGGAGSLSRAGRRSDRSDWFMVGADFDAYADAQRRVAARWRDRHAWWRSSVLNTAHMGWFSSDRTIREYADGDLGRASPLTRCYATLIRAIEASHGHTVPAG